MAALIQQERQVQGATEEFVVRVRDLPAFKELKEKVDVIVKKASWLEKYGLDTAHFAFGCVAYALGLALLAGNRPGHVVCGLLSLGLGHVILAYKISHLSAHGSMGDSALYNRLVCWLTGEVIGMFPMDAGYDIHIKQHHPHTNIIGMGDSSTWRAPMLPRLVYLFLAPGLMPLATPLVGAHLLLGRPLRLMTFAASCAIGLTVCLWPLVALCGYSLPGAVAALFLGRGIFSVSYLHINIFQHIGLPMWSQGSRPARLYQMASGVLNLTSNPLLDLAFGHALVSCHVEHHLFPHLSDSMCLRVKPTVRQFLRDSGLPYNEDSYGNRLGVFMADYDRLMVDAPPIWHYVGLQ